MRDDKDSLLERIPLMAEQPWISYPLAIAFIAIAYVLRVTAQDMLPNGFPYVTFFPAVIVASFLFGVGPAIVAGIIGGFVSYFCFILPSQNGEHTLMGAIAIMLYIVVVTVDIILIHLMQTANNKLKQERERNKQLAETHEMLFHELQHRVSNNLQVIGAILRLQQHGVTDKKARHALNEASRRISLIGRISRSLYSSDNGRHRIEPFLEMLTADIVQANGRDDIHITLDVRYDPDLPSAVSIPMAIIVAESVNNAIEHGFAEQGGTVHISVEQGPDSAIHVSIIDNGVGLPPEFDLNNTESLGLRIATNLAKQLKGSFELAADTSGGVAAQLKLPL